jgi:hypothetical protein
MAGDWVKKGVEKKRSGEKSGVEVIIGGQERCSGEKSAVEIIRGGERRSREEVRRKVSSGGSYEVFRRGGQERRFVL